MTRGFDLNIPGFLLEQERQDEGNRVQRQQGIQDAGIGAGVRINDGSHLVSGQAGDSPRRETKPVNTADILHVEVVREEDRQAAEPAAVDGVHDAYQDDVQDALLAEHRHEHRRDGDNQEDTLEHAAL